MPSRLIPFASFVPRQSLRSLILPVVLAGAAIGCANRGMVAPSGDGGGSGGSPTDTRLDISMTDLGSGGDTGGGAPDRPREVYEAAPLPCNTRFNFENGATYGAMLGTDATMAFKAVGPGVHTACGFGSLQITATFSGTMGATAKGTVVIDLPAPENLTGKTLSLKVSADPPIATGGPSLTLSLVSMGGFVDLPTIRNIPGGYSDLISYPLPPPAPDAGATTRDVSAVKTIVIVGTDFNGFVGKLFIDELDIK